MGKGETLDVLVVFPLAVCEILLFSTPQMEQKMQYAYFFVVYTLLNSIFYTANNISYAALTALMTKNPHERVQAGTYRFMFVMLAGILIPAMTTGLVGAFGGGTAGWRSVAVIYTIVMVAFNMLVVFSVKEVTDEGEKAEDSDGITFLQSIRDAGRQPLLSPDPRILSAAVRDAGSHKRRWNFLLHLCSGNPDALGLLSFAGMVPMILGLAVTPALVKRYGIYRVNLVGMLFSVVFGLVFIPVAILGICR